MELATWSLHPLMAGVAGAEQQLPAFCGVLAVQVASMPPLCFVLNPVSFTLTHDPPGSWGHLSV